MKITVHSSKAVKPAYGANAGPFAAVGDAIPLTVFDKATFDEYISGITFFRPPAPPNAALEAGLARALAEYREWAGRLGADARGGRAIIILSDAGARFVEATADVALAAVMPALLEPSPAVADLHPSAGGGGAGELLMVQLTRFECGSLAVGHTMSHVVGDGHAACNFLLAWGQATRRAPIDPAPAHDRASRFLPRVPPRVEFDHRGVEFKPPARPHHRPHGGKASCGGGSYAGDVVVVHRAHFSREMLSELRSRASSSAPRPYSTAVCLAAHLWRCITRARGLDGGTVVPEGYTGNVVLWAWPAATARELVEDGPPWRAAELVSRSVARVDGGYFRSFVDFASSGAVEEERLVPAAVAAEKVLSPDVEVDSLLHAAFCDVDFGGGRPFLFMPGYLPNEGSVFIVRSFSGDGGVGAYVPLFSRAMERFKECCYSLATADARL
ncbi:unnamed protein product [Urochloa decumbens]|uniref:Agmatine coumaroyltransferase-2-like n=1 Tax=Urochloa decumbens TaxID=240449 RepID=A0ABC9F1R6_9POAL